MAPIKSAHGGASVSISPWVGFDLDGTLCEWVRWTKWDTFGKVLVPMKTILLEHLATGDECKIFTARVAYPRDICYVTGEEFTSSMMESRIQDHLMKDGLPRLACTAIKDHRLRIFYDDRAIQVILNTGRTLADAHAAELAALKGAP